MGDSLATAGRRWFLLAVAFILPACSVPHVVEKDRGAISDEVGIGAKPSTAAGWQEARILTPPSPLQCVPYARQLSGIEIRGDAWTWWRAAEGKYPRSATPVIGSVLVLKRSRHLRGGHLAVVTGIRNEREIVVEHANWLNRGRIHRGALVADVSSMNDWSAVRLWYTPGRQYGVRIYPVSGFILPAATASASRQAETPRTVRAAPRLP